MRLIHGDALEVLRTLDNASVDAIVTDPPYLKTGNGSSSRVSRSQASAIPEERQFFDLWMRALWQEFSRVLKPTGALWLTIDWRGAMACEAAAVGSPLKVGGVGVWDKELIGMGHMLRHSYECFVAAKMPEWERVTASESDVWRVRWSSRGATTGHEAEKPLALFARACDLLGVRDGHVVLDPFCGSGTAGVAAMALGAAFIGIEREAAYVDVAHRRIAEAQKAQVV